MPSGEELLAHRHAVHRRLYHEANGNRLNWWEYGDSDLAGLSEEDFERAARWLVDHGLARFPTFGKVLEITSDGMDIAEEQLGVLEAGETAQPVEVEATAVITHVQAQLLEALVGEIRRSIEAGEVRLAAPDMADIEGQLDTLSAQIRSGRPKRKVVGWALAALTFVGGSVVGGIVGNAAYAGLLQLMPS